MFEDSSVNLDVLKRKAFNLRWATVPDGVIPLTAADPDFPGAPEIREAIQNFIKDGYLSYGPPDGLPEFKQAMSTFFTEKRLIPNSPSFLFPVDSAASGIYITCKAFLSPGDEAIIFDPVDFLFRYSIESLGATAVPFAIPPGTTSIDFEKLGTLITGKTKMLCLCNPLNPTGKVFTRVELQEFASLAHKHNLIILSDEIWSDIIFTPNQFTSIASLDEDTRQRTVTVTGFSKSYGLAGLRIGSVMAANQRHFDMLLAASLHQSTIHGANVLGQVAATAALTKCDYWLNDFVTHLQRMRTIVTAGLNDLPGVQCREPEGCYVAFADITGTGMSSSEFAELLLKEGKVSVVPGLKQWFGAGAEGFIRVSFATSQAILDLALARMKNTIK